MRGNNTKVFWAALVALGVTATWPDSAWSEWQTYNTRDGLSDDRVQSVLEDRHGNLWFGTYEGGVSRYDGVSWRTYLEHSGVRSMLEDRDGNLWFARGGYGASRYDGVTWRTYSTSDGLAGNDVRAMLEDHAGNIWFGTTAGVTRYDGVNWVTFTTADGLAGNAVYSICEDRDGNLWFGTARNGVSRYDGSSWVTYYDVGFVDRPDEFVVYAICEDRSGNIWFGTSNGVSRYDGGSWRTYTTADGLGSNLIAAILEDRQGDLWFAAVYGGVSRYDGVSWRTYTTMDGLESDMVYAICEDRAGNMWFGTWGGGVSRYDGSSWRTYTTDDGLAYDHVRAVAEDSMGRLWFGTRGVRVYGSAASCYDGISWRTYTSSDIRCIVADRLGNLWFGTDNGVSLFDGAHWRSYGSADGLGDNSVYAILEDRFGNLWFGTEYGGVSCYDGESWRTFKTEDGLADIMVFSICEDSSGRLWFGTGRRGVSRYDGTSWVTYTAGDGLPSDTIYSICEDRFGNMWFGTDNGAARFDGVGWERYTIADGLSGNTVHSIIKDKAGNLWFATGYGVTRYDGINWGTYTTAGAPGRLTAISIAEDHRGRLWFGTLDKGVSVHEPDRIPPQAVIWPQPARLSASTAQTINFTAAFREISGITFSYSFDGSPWSDWATLDFLQVADLSDGEHRFEVTARDLIGNADTTAALCVFEIDAEAPIPIITSPGPREAVRGLVGVSGTADDLRFRKYRADVRGPGAAAWDSLMEASTAVRDGVLCSWDTSLLSDGDYTLRLSVTDTLGLTGTALVNVMVDNNWPWAHETAPAVVRAVSGGDIYSADGEMHLYFPPGAFSQDAEVDILVPEDSNVPDTLAGGARRMTRGYEISWRGTVLVKPAVLEMSYPDPEMCLVGALGSEVDNTVAALWAGESGSGSGDGQGASAGGAITIYMFDTDSTWHRLGGTIDPIAKCVSCPVTEPGVYSVFVEEEVVLGSGVLSGLSVTPRVFSPLGGFASREAAIGFTLGRPGPVTVKIFNRGGRLVREVIAGEQMNGGANLVRWDGRDLDGEVVEDGVYLVTVEALGARQVKPLAVVR